MASSQQLSFHLSEVVRLVEEQRGLISQQEAEISRLQAELESLRSSDEEKERVYFDLHINIFFFCAPKII